MSPEKTPSVATRMLRLLKMVHVLKVQPDIEPSKLHEKLGISKSRFSDDRKVLKALGFEFEYSRKEKRYHITDEPFFPVVNFHFSEIFSLIMALRQVSAKSDHAIATHAITAIQKMVASIHNAEARELLRFALEDLTLKAGLGCSARLLEQLWEAARDGRRVLLWHRSPIDGQERECEFAPYVLFFRKRALYVDGYRPNPIEHRGFRTFRVNRIRRVEIQPNKYPTHEEYDFSQRWKHVYHLFGAGKPYVVLRIRFSPKAAPYIREVQWHHTQSIVELPAGGCELILKIAEPKEAIRDFMGWITEMEILEPPAMREWLQGELRRALEVYS